MKESELAGAYGLREIPRIDNRKVRSRSRWAPWPEVKVPDNAPRHCPRKGCLTMTPGGRLCHFDARTIAA